MSDYTIVACPNGNPCAETQECHGDLVGMPEHCPGTKVASPASDYPGPAEGASGPRSTGEAPQCMSAAEPCRQEGMYEIEHVRTRDGQPVLTYVCPAHLPLVMAARIVLSHNKQVVVTLVGDAR